MLRAIHRQPLVVTRTIARALALSAINKGNIVPDIAVSNTVLELRLLAADKLISLADLQRGAAAIACAAEGLGVLCACGNMDR